VHIVVRTPQQCYCEGTTNFYSKVKKVLQPQNLNLIKIFQFLPALSDMNFFETGIAIAIFHSVQECQGEE